MKKLLFLVLSLASIPCRGQSTKNVLEKNQGKYYSVLLMKVTDEAKYQDYKEQLLPILSAKGGYLEREFEAALLRGNIREIGQPNRVLVIYLGTPAKEKRLKRNKKYATAQKMLAAAVEDLRVIKGTSALFQSSESNIDGRFYLMKISYYKENTEGREEMLTAIGPLLDPYGFKTERMIMGATAEGFATPDEVSIHFHEEAAQAGALLQDSKATQAIGQYNEKYIDKFAYFSLRLK